MIDPRITHADCLDWLPTLEAESVDLILMDPPYSSGTRREAAKGLRKSMVRGREDDAWFGSDCLTTNGFWWLMRALSVQCRRVLSPGAHLISFIDWRQYPALVGAIESADLRHVGLLVWDKTYFGMGTYFRNQHELMVHFSRGKTRPSYRHDVGNVIACRPVRQGKHPTEKPVELLLPIIETLTKPGDLVIDPFAGSGSAGVAAAQLGRRFMGCERDPEYVQIAEARLAHWVGERLPIGAT